MTSGEVGGLTRPVAGAACVGGRGNGPACPRREEDGRRSLGSGLSLFPSPRSWASRSGRGRARDGPGVVSGSTAERGGRTEWVARGVRRTVSPLGGDPGWPRRTCRSVRSLPVNNSFFRPTTYPCQLLSVN